MDPSDTVSTATAECGNAGVGHRNSVSHTPSPSASHHHELHLPIVVSETGGGFLGALANLGRRLSGNRKEHRSAALSSVVVSSLEAAAKANTNERSNEDKSNADGWTSTKTTAVASEKYRLSTSQPIVTISVSTADDNKEVMGIAPNCPSPLPLSPCQTFFPSISTVGAGPADEAVTATETSGQFPRNVVLVAAGSKVVEQRSNGPLVTKSSDNSSSSNPSKDAEIATAAAARTPKESSHPVFPVVRCVISEQSIKVQDEKKYAKLLGFGSEVSKGMDPDEILRKKVKLMMNQITNGVSAWNRRPSAILEGSVEMRSHYVGRFVVLLFSSLPPPPLSLPFAFVSSLFLPPSVYSLIIWNTAIKWWTLEGGSTTSGLLSSFSLLSFRLGAHVHRPS